MKHKSYELVHHVLRMLKHVQDGDFLCALISLLGRSFLEMSLIKDVLNWMVWILGSEQYSLLYISNKKGEHDRGRGQTLLGQ